ncbi:MAG TPA: hypothetical protein VNQ99_16210 [Xanthobacteraceae bacterium]|nr:hypothetical protein [Xanthobacteraceae bacterium]
MPKSSNPAAAASLPVVLAVTDADIEALSFNEVRGLCQAIRTIAQVTEAMTCQPRFEEGDTAVLNGAGVILNNITEFAYDLEKALVERATAAKPASLADARARAWTILAFDLAIGDGLAQHAVRAAQAVRDEQVLLFGWSASGRCV